MKVNVNATRTAYEFSVVEGSYEFVGTFTTRGTGEYREFNATVNLVSESKDASMGDMKSYVGNISYNHPEGMKPADPMMGGTGVSTTSASINVNDDHFDAVFSIFKSVIAAVEAECV